MRSYRGLTAVTLGQSATWTCPLPSFNGERNAFTMVNALLGRIHPSRLIDQLSYQQFSFIVE